MIKLQEQTLYILATIFAVAVFFLLLFLVYRSRKEKQKTGKSQGRAYNVGKVTAAMRGFARQNSFRLIEPACIRRGEDVADLDAVVVGYFGVLGVISLGYSGEVYGNAGDEAWLQVAEDGSRNHFPNPIDEASAAVRVIRDALFEAKLKKVPVEVVYVFTNDKAQLALPRSIQYLKTKGFKDLLKKDKYLEDSGLDLDAVEKAIRSSVEK